MNKTSAKMMAVVVTALFCVSAIAAVFVSDDSSAASTTHKVYIEIVGDDGLVTSTQWFAFESDGTAQGFATSATAAAAKYGLNDVSFTYSEDYGGSISANYTGGYGSACYIVKDGAWATSQNTAEEYPAAGVLGFALNYGYITKTIYDGLTDAQKQKFAETGFGDEWYAIKILEAAPSAAPADRSVLR